MKYLIGIDSGGTKTELIAYDLNCCPVYSDVGGFGNPAVNLEETISNVSKLIKDCIIKLGEGNCIMIAIGMAAVETGNYITIIKNHIEEKFNIKTAVLNDAHMALKAYFGNRDGIIVIAGTGSSCFVQKNGKEDMVGGWSHILGDEGSGYHIVIEAFKNIIYKFDRNIPYDNLSKLLTEKIGGNTRSNIMNFVYNNQKNIIASLFPIIVEAADKGSEDALFLLIKAGENLAELTVTAYRKMNFDIKENISIGLKGGIFYHSNLVLSSFKNELNKKIKNFHLIEKDFSTTRGVFNLYDDSRK